MAVQDYKINYKSDFVLNINGDAGWAVPFCIKFWTGMPSQAYFVGFDGVKYVNCRVGDTPTQLLVMFDDHHLPIGKLKMQIAYHTTIEEFPGSVFDEVTNARDVIVTIDGTDYQVLLDFTGEDTPELEFDLPAYANEAERIQNELQRQQNEADRIAAELQREQATAAAVQGAENVNAQLNGTTLTVTNRQGVSTSVNTKGEQGEQGPVGPQGETGETGPRGTSIVSFTPKSTTATTLIYTVTFSDGTTQEVPIPKGAKGDTGATGPQGPQGDTGVSITAFTYASETETDMIYTVTFSDSTTQQVAIPKGEKGDTGEQGPVGPQGPQGPMGDVAVITPEQQAAFTMYSEPGQNTNGPMTQKAVTELIYPQYDFGLDWHIIGSESGGQWVNAKTRILFLLGSVNVGALVHIKVNSGYRFVITGYNILIQGVYDITPSHFVEQYENAWVTEDTYVVPSGVKSLVLKVSKTNDKDITGDDPNGMISIATISGNVNIYEKRIDDLDDDVDDLGGDMFRSPYSKNIELNNYLYFSETNGSWNWTNYRISFLLGPVNYNDIVHIKSNTGYRFVITAYNVVVNDIFDVTPSNFVEQYENAWVTEDTYVVPSGVKSLVLKVSKTNDAVIQNDDPSNMISVATISSTGGAIYQISDLNVLTKNGLYVGYEGEPIVLQNRMGYTYIGNADDRYMEGSTARAAEGLAVFGDYMFRFYINGLAKSFDISSGHPVLISSFQLGSHALNSNHCNCAQFANSVASGNTFPYVYIANCVYPICYVEQITTSSSSLIQTITVNSSFSFVWCNVCAGDDGYLYSVGINCQANVNGTMKVIKHQLPSPSQGNVTLNDADAVDLFEIPYDGSVHGLQGMEIRNGKIFLPMNGTGNAINGIIRVIDIESRSIQTDIPISFHPYECEDVSVYGDIMYIGYFNSNSIYKLMF